MNRWNEGVLQETVSRLTAVSIDERSSILEGPSGNENHRAHFDRLAVLRQIEAVGTAAREHIDGPATIAFWNVERLRHIDAIAETLKTYSPDVMLLCEVDRGMARTLNTDRIVDLAGRLDRPYLFAVEFVELGLGDRHEQRDHAGEQNTDGFHGAALLADAAMSTPFLIRLDDRGNWFDGALEERRVGGTIALGAKIVVAGKPVTMISVHLESHCDPAMRADDMKGLLERIETISAGEPVIMGGDFNTSTAGLAERMDRDAWRERVANEPYRLTSPEPYEPLFGLAAQFGYDWRSANVMGVPTQRFAPGSNRSNHKLDWFFTRGLMATDPRIIPAVRPDGQPSSDHEALLVTIAPSVT